MLSILELWSNFMLISKQDLKEQVSAWAQLYEVAAGSSPASSNAPCLNQRCKLQACSGHAAPYGSLPRCEFHLPTDSNGSLLANRAAVIPLIPNQLMKGSWQYSWVEIAPLFFFFNLSCNLLLKISIFSEEAATWEMNSVFKPSCEDFSVCFA